MSFKKWGLAFILLIIYISLPVGQASAAPVLDVQAKIGIENKIKMKMGMPLDVTITNSGDSFSGDFVIESQVHYSVGSALIYPIDIAAGESKTIHINLEGYSEDLVYGNNNKDFFHFYEDGIDKGKKISYKGTKKLTPKLYGEESKFVYTLTENSDRLSAFKRLEQYNQYEVEVFNLNQLKDYKLPTDVRELELADVIVVDEYNISDLSDAQQQALVSWVQQGGTLLVGASDQVEASVGVFSTYLPLKLGDERLKVSKEGLIKLSGGGTFSNGIDVYSATEKEGSTRLMAEGEVLIASATVLGQGRVIQTTFSLGDDPIASMDGYGKLISELLAFSKNNSVNLNMNGVSINGFEMPTEWLSENELFPSFEISTLWMIALVIAYILLIGPVLYLVLKRKDKREAAWWIIPIGAVVISLILFIIGGKDRLLKPQIQQMALFQVNEDESLRGWYTNALLTNRGGDFKFITEGNTSALASTQSNIITGDLHQQSYVKNHANESELTLKDLSYWSVQSVVGNTMIQQAGKFITQLTVKNGKLEGTVESTFPFTLKNVTILSGSQKIELGDLEANGKLTISQDINRNTLPGVTAGYPTYPSSQSKEELISNRLEYLKYSAGRVAEEERMPVITAWTEDALVPITLSGNANMETVSYFFQTFNPEIELVGSVKLTMDDLQQEIFPIGNTGYVELAGEPGNKRWYMEEGQYKYMVGFNSDVEPKNFKWEELEIKSQTKDLTIEIENQRTKSYELIDQSKLLLKEDVKNYFDEEDKIVFRITRDQDMTGSPVRLPELTLKGEVKQ